MAPGPTRTARLVRDRLTITAKGLVKVYRVEELSPDPSVGTPAFRLTELSSESFEPCGTPYCVIVRTHGCDCECLGFLRWGHRKPCRHIGALRAVGLLKAE